MNSDYPVTFFGLAKIKKDLPRMFREICALKSYYAERSIASSAFKLSTSSDKGRPTTFV